MNKKIGIVTILYNSETVLNDFFESLSQQTYKNFILYLIDNKSKDESVKRTKELMQKSPFKCILVENEGNYGVAKGNNIGIKTALKDNCDYVLLSNNDIILKQDAIEELYRGLINVTADIAVPKIFYWKPSNLLWMAGGKFRWIHGTTQHIGFEKEDAKEYNQIKQITYAPTCFMLIKADVFDKIGFMDENYFVYYDDSDFIWRAVHNNIRLYYIPKSSIKHKVSVSTGGSSSEFIIKCVNRNQIYFILKNFSKLHRLCTLTFLFCKFVFKTKRTKNKNYRDLVISSYKEGINLYRSLK